MERDGRTTDVASYTASLLRMDARNPGKKLAECFPAIKIGKGKGR